MAIKVHSGLFVHPGPWLRRNVLDHYGVSVTEAAKHLDVSRPPLNNMLNGKQALSADMAMRFERAFFISARTLVNMQAQYDLAQVKDAPRFKRVTVHSGAKTFKAKSGSAKSANPLKETA